MSTGYFQTLNPGDEKRLSTRTSSDGVTVEDGMGENRLGEIGYMYPSRWFKYAVAGEDATVALLQTTITAAANHDLDLVMSAAASVGATTVLPTLGATAAVKNEYRGGFFIVNDAGTEQGHQYLIRGHEAVDSSGVMTCLLDEQDGLVTALTTSEQVGLVHNDCHDFVVNPTTITDAPLGATCVDIPDNSFGWLQYSGQGLATADSTGAGQGEPIASSPNTAGNIVLMDYSGSADLPPVGYMRDTASASGEACPVKWNMA